MDPMLFQIFTNDLDESMEILIKFVMDTKLVEVANIPEDILHQWSPTLGLQMFLDFNSQKSWPAEVVVKASGSCSPRTSGDPRLETTVLEHSEGHKWQLVVI